MIKTREELIDEIRAMQSDTDYEASHSQADKILCDLLRDLGYGDVVDEYLKLNRWCA